MTNLDELEDLLRKCEKEKAYKLVKEDKGITAWTLINEGITFGTIREYDLSISYFELAEKISEDDKIKEAAREQLAVAYYNRGLAYARSNQYEEAIKDFKKALELNPKYAGAYNNRGNVYHELKQYKKAIEDYKEALELNPNLTVTYYNRGIAYCKLNKTEEAIEDYNAAIKLNSKYAKAYYNRGIAYYDLDNYEKAIKDFKKALELNPKDVEAYRMGESKESDEPKELGCF
jgi:tetratricopeptide (TPR) repeat protein